ncbi:bifunctional diaminohydroxyphosphoribosylaminopyrimidine deaminase/5-amino-6-(5-phosphoribosylamino)uracil reductase RibD [Aciditerrimonas ferrireducens]|nr:bifunctional diaminohydroxyphosphoribosylaminopyrimidine deaminase/5-amino-6-(5-phosphoribosylamino)uracil reductase RibD [Aciditerrimonas ferrireducens]MCK4177371.1 bifunctional diaminohydroxyphosphoribosylaminopyrimidine deaminase/5-amino-6-(5-phosphoribosylamino)uracil reductase RibD [Aciditerrimonas ferrireducens]
MSGAALRQEPASTPASGRADGPWSAAEEAAMGRALALAGERGPAVAPNPWVGCVVLGPEGQVVGEGATEPPGGRHAEVVALEAAGAAARGGTLVVTLEPCSHHGRTPPCVDAVLAAGVRRVVVGLEDPDPRVQGRGLAALAAGGVEVRSGLRAEAVEEQLAPYLTHRRTGRPYVVLKLAASLDGRIAAPDRSSKWLTGPEARADVHRLRAASQAVLVGAGTVRADDPELTVRLPGHAEDRQPLRVVLGAVPPGARVEPAEQVGGDLVTVLEDLGRRGVLQLLVEGGAAVAHAFHAAGLVDRYVFYYAPALFGGADALPMFAGPGAQSMGALWRGRIVGVARLGDDLKVELVPARPGRPGGKVA